MVVVSRDEMFIAKLEAEVVKATNKIGELVKEFSL
jgi:hypothetical protein